MSCKRLGLGLHSESPCFKSVCPNSHQPAHPIFRAGRESRAHEWGEWSRLGARGLSSCSPPAHSYSRASHLQRARTILTSLKKTKTAQFASPALPTPPPALALTTKFCHSLIAKTFLTYIRNDKQCHFRNMNNLQAPHSQKEIKFFPEMRG